MGVLTPADEFEGALSDVNLESRQLGIESKKMDADEGRDFFSLAAEHEIHGRQSTHVSIMSPFMFFEPRRLGISFVATVMSTLIAFLGSRVGGGYHDSVNERHGRRWLATTV